MKFPISRRFSRRGKLPAAAAYENHAAWRRSAAADNTASVVPVVGSTTLVPTSDGPPCVLMMYANCRAFSKFTPRASVLGEVLGHLEVIDTADNRDHLFKRFRSLFHNHFTPVPVDIVQRHHALFRKANKPVIGLKLDSLGLVYSRPAGL